MQTTKHAEIDSAIAQVAAGLTQLRGLMQDPSDLSFELLHPHFEHLERALGNKAAIDAAFAFIAERDDAGRRVGSSKAKDYLTARLGLSESEAAARLRNGRNLFAPIPEPEPTPPPADPDADDATRAQAEELARRRADRERREPREERQPHAGADRRRRHPIRRPARDGDLRRRSSWRTPRRRLDRGRDRRSRHRRG